MRRKGTNSHECPDTTSAATAVIRILGAVLIINMLGTFISCIIRKEPPPDWTKEVIMAVVIGLVGLLGNAKRSDTNGYTSETTDVTVINKPTNPVPITSDD